MGRNARAIRKLTRHVTRPFLHGRNLDVRIQGASTNDDPQVAEVFRQQVSRWGATLKPYEVYARRPSIFMSVIGMWNGIKMSGLIDPSLSALINRRVASLNGCLF